MTAWITNSLTALGRMVRAGPTSTSTAWADRRAVFALWDGYYGNSIFETLNNGGQREYLNSMLGNAEAADLAGLFNPVASVVDLYLQVFGGEWGKDVKCQGSPAVLAALDQVWKWTNINKEQQPLCRMAATLGTVGIRVVWRDADDPARRRVYLKAEHPRIIRDVQVDDRGNVEGIELEYDEARGLGDDQEVWTIRETLTPKEMRVERVQLGTPRLISSDPNPLGVTPYVLLQHGYTGDVWGFNAFYRARQPLDRLNALLSHIDVQIHRHVRAKWAIFASGGPPSEIDLGDLSVAFFDTRNSATPPVMQPMVAPLALADATDQAKLQIELVEDMLPELKALAGKYLSGQSGETITELRKPAEDAILLARSNYEDALMKAQQIALSAGVRIGLWNLGTGTGTWEAAERAYQGGYEDHTFIARPAFRGDAAPQTEQRVTQPVTMEGMNEGQTDTGADAATAARGGTNGRNP
jgi:hypothetical protein